MGLGRSELGLGKNLKNQMDIPLNGHTDGIGGLMEVSI